jgi:hypothetical protein
MVKVMFEIGEQVKIKGTDKVGVVKAYKIDGYLLHDKKQVVIKYCVQVGASHYNDWYQEQHLELLNSYDFNSKFELGLLDFLIDIYLLNNKIDLVKKLHTEKKLYEVK